MNALIGSKRTATLFTWVVLTVFCTIIFTGWWYFFEPTLGHRVAAWAAAFALTFLAALCARQIGQLRADWVINRTGNRWHWLVPYFFLIFISALGTLNAAFYLFEGRNILRQDIASVRSAYTALRDEASKTLPPPGYAQRAAQVEALLKNLHEEIVNPFRGGYCGVGPVATSIIADIRQALPEYRVLNGSGPINPCDVERAEDVYRSYAEKAHDLLKRDTRSGADAPAKLAFLDELHRRYAKMDGELGDLEVTAGGVGGTQSLHVRALLDARNAYRSDRAAYYSLLGEKVGTLPELRTLQTEDVNNYARLPDLLRRRIFHFETIFYLFIAVGLDLFLIYLLMNLNVRYGARRKREKEDTIEPRYQTDPKFLWINSN